MGWYSWSGDYNHSTKDSGSGSGINIIGICSTGNAVDTGIEEHIST